VVSVAILGIAAFAAWSAGRRRRPDEGTP
jgi:hypothetical protein